VASGRRVRDGLSRRITGLPGWARWAASPYPPGHYHSPLPDIAAARLLRETENAPDSVAGIDTRHDEQLALVDEFAGYYAEIPFGQDAKPGLRYHLDCTWFAHGDGVALYSMLRHLRPRRYLELGSGWSSACALDTADRFLDGTVQFTFVEPNPQRLRSVLRSSDEQRVTILDAPDTPLDFALFADLEPGDVLFIDSSHVSKYGSEVNRLVLDIFPRLPGGVHIHVHDIFWPFSYPVRWLEKGRAWNEAYLLRAWLCDNPRARVTWFNNYLAHAARDKVGHALPAWARDPGSSIWIETVP
jgi:methyltransferase family protein